MKTKAKLFYPILSLAFICAYTYLPWEIPNLPLWGDFSDLKFYIIGTLACAIVAILAVILLYQTGNWQTINSKKFRWSYLAYAFLTIFLNYVWNVVANLLLPPAQNAASYKHAVTSFTGGMVFLMIFLYPIILAPIFEEVIYCGLAMTALERGKVWGLDVLGFAALFSALHVVGQGWSWADFLFYFVPGLLYGVFFKVTKSIYWSIGAHMAYNGFVQLFLLLR